MAPSTLLGNSWLGKALAATLVLAFVAPGFAGYGPLGASTGLFATLVLALALGHQWDQFARRRFSPTLARASAARLLADLRRYSPWVLLSACGMGRLANTAGGTRPHHWQLVEELAQRQGWQGRHRHRLISWFNAGAQSDCPFDEIAQRCALQSDPAQEALLLEFLGRCAALDDGPRSREVLRDLGSLLHFHAQQRRAQGRGAAGAVDDERLALESAAALLEVTIDDAPAAIKQAYRRGVARFHPDRLPTDANATQQQLAGQRMVALREAYERLLAAASAAEPVGAPASRRTQPRTVRSNKPSTDRNG